MKKIFFVLLWCIYINSNYGQCSCCISSSGISAGESTPASYALEKRQWLFEVYEDYRTYKGSLISSTEDHQPTNSVGIENTFVTGIGLRYGLTKKLSLAMQQPYIFINTPNVSSIAFGDLLSLINYSAFSRSNFVIGLQAGMEWPTGQNVSYGNGNVVSAGSGSFDPVAGLNISKGFKRSNFRLNAFYKYSTIGFNEINYGNFFSHQMAYNFFILNPVTSCESDSTKENKINKKVSLSVGIQFAGEWSQAQMQHHSMLANTGGYLILAGCGVNLGLKGFTIPIIISAPLYRITLGTQTQNSLRLRIGLAKTF